MNAKTRRVVGWDLNQWAVGVVAAMTRTPVPVKVVEREILKIAEERAAQRRIAK